ncbi:MAG: circularly permuted type 2 ATP-grasp protein [Euzebya sp.]
MIARDGSVHPAWRSLGQALSQMDQRELRRVRAETARLLEDDGVTYHIPGTGERRPWLLDPLPLMISADDWGTIEAGVVQRAELLNLILSDLYGRQRLLEDGLLPPRLVFGHQGFLRPLHQQRLRGDHQLFSYAVDLLRGPSGIAVVLADRTQAPSGAAYALQNRVVTSRVMGQLHRTSQVQRLAPYFRALRQGLQEVAPDGTTLPRTVLLTPGSRNETAFEHAFLAARLGLSLVEGSDLVVQDGRVWLQSLGRLEPVDVILRRMDQDWCDPLELRPDSVIGVPGLVQAVRSKTVAVVNTLGSGVLENPALQAFLPDIAQRLLGQPLRLAGVRTMWCGVTDSRREVLADLSQWVLRPIVGTAGSDNAFVGAGLDQRQCGALRAAIVANPHGWVAQEPLVPASAPSLSDEGVVPRPTVLRAFAVADGGGYTVMPGGLTRVARSPGDLVIANHHGALSKDTWVLAGKPERMTGFWLDPAVDVMDVPESGMPARAAENLFWLGRYAERAEGVVRLLREIEDRRTEFTDTQTGAGIACIHALLQALTQVTATYPGFIGEGAEGRLSTPDDELDMVATDDGRAGTLAHAITRLLDCVDAVRDQLSGDTWLVVVDLQRRVRGAEPGRTLAGDRAQVLHGLLAIQGLGAENMVRDDGWRFMDAGRRLERALQMLALLRATTTHVRDTPADSLVLESVLRVTESILTYRRRYRSHAQIGTVLDLLLMAPANPRSLTYQLDLLAQDLKLLPNLSTGAIGVSERAVLEAATALRVADTRMLGARADGTVRTDLDEFLAHLQGVLIRAGDAVSDAYFVPSKRQRVMDTDTAAALRRVAS